jgi:hypothetical protein
MPLRALVLIFFSSLPSDLFAQPSTAQLRVFLDCDDCFENYLQSEITFVDYVRDRTEADVHVIVTESDTGGGGREYTIQFMGAAARQGADRTLRTITAASESEDAIRRQIATTLRVGLLGYITAEEVPPGLNVDVELGTEASRPAVAGDRWNNWVFTLEGSGTFEGQESTREVEVGAEISADRITPDWKLTFGGFLEHRNQRFEVDEDEGDEPAVRAERRQREVQFVAVKALGEHWSAGAQGEVVSSTFDNTKLAVAGAPAVEFNVFPYSAYTRRQLRILYAVGVERAEYYEETLFGRLRETHPIHVLSATFDQTEPWGSLEAQIEWEQYLHNPSLARLEAEGDMTWRLARGFSLSAEVNASRVRNQISLRRRGATPEEVLLELRELRSGYEYSLSFGVSYTFGSIFSSIVNPRFGQ